MLEFLTLRCLEVSLKVRKLEMAFSVIWTVYKLAFRTDKSKTL